MADKNTSFHEGTTEPVGEQSSYGWTPGGDGSNSFSWQPGAGAPPADAGSTSSYGWSGDNGESGDSESYGG